MAFNMCKKTVSQHRQKKLYLSDSLFMCISQKRDSIIHLKWSAGSCCKQHCCRGETGREHGSHSSSYHALELSFLCTGHFTSSCPDYFNLRSCQLYIIKTINYTTESVLTLALYNYITFVQISHAINSPGKMPNGITYVRCSKSTFIWETHDLATNTL